MGNQKPVCHQQQQLVTCVYEHFHDDINNMLITFRNIFVLEIRSVLTKKGVKIILLHVGSKNVNAFQLKYLSF